MTKTPAVRKGQAPAFDPKAPRYNPSIPGPFKQRPAAAPVRKDEEGDEEEAPRVKKPRWVDKEGNRRKRDRANAPGSAAPSARSPRPIKGDKPAPQQRKSSKPYKK